MKSWLSCLIGIAMFAVCGLGTAVAQTHSRAGTVVVPPTSVVRPQDLGKRAHTNFLIFVPAQKGAKPYFGGTSPGGETPSSLACVYQIGPSNNSDCLISDGNFDNPVGGSNVIAIVDAYDYPTACSDFNAFSTEFGLPKADCNNNETDPHFRVVYASGSQPRANCGWGQEAALDIEWAHAMAPNAQIVLVEAASNSNNDLLQAVQVASNEVVCGNTSCPNGGNGVGQVSMSWGGSEFSDESTLDSYFSTAGVTYFASSGDNGGKVNWPSASANVISAGGTSVNRGSGGIFKSESAWSSAGGGPSKYVPMPDYQSAIQDFAKILNGYRGTPDFSFDADPYTGVSVYDSTRCQGMSGWLVFGGTSVASPSLAGIFNLAGAFSGGWDGGGNSSSVQNKLYQSFASVSNNGSSCNYSSELYDVDSGSAGSYAATACWDFASGIGTDRGDSALAGSTSSSASFSLSANPSSLSLTAGDTNSTISISVAPSGGFNGNVTLSGPSSLPSGMSVSFSPNPVDITGTSAVPSTMTVITSTSTPPGTYNLAIQGSGGSSGPSSSVTVPVTVTSASSGGDFSISASPGNVTLHGGGTASYSVTITPSGGFNQQVDFSMTPSPGGPQAAFSPASVTGSGTTTMTVTPPSGKASYTLTITGSVSGGPSHSTTVGLKVR